VQVASSDPQTAPDATLSVLYTDACSSSNELGLSVLFDRLVTSLFSVSTWCAFDKNFFSTANSIQLMPATNSGIDWAPQVPYFSPIVRVRSITMSARISPVMKDDSLYFRLVAIFYFLN
jgi:hypothetical protein